MFGSDAEIVAVSLAGSVVLLLILILPVLLLIATRYLIRRKKLSIAGGQDFKIGNSSIYDVFISYSHKDEEVVGKIAEKLRNKNIRVFVSSSDIDAGDDFSEEIKKALQDAGELWILASPSSMASTWVMTEWGAGWAMGKRIVPILYNCTVKNLPERLAALHTVQFDKLDQEILNLVNRMKQDGQQ